MSLLTLLPRQHIALIPTVCSSLVEAADTAESENGQNRHPYGAGVLEWEKKNASKQICNMAGIDKSYGDELRGKRETKVVFMWDDQKGVSD